MSRCCRRVAKNLTDYQNKAKLPKKAKRRVAKNLQKYEDKAKNVTPVEKQNETAQQSLLSFLDDQKIREYSKPDVPNVVVQKVVDSEQLNKLFESDYRTSCLFSFDEEELRSEFLVLRDVFESGFIDKQEYLERKRGLDKLLVKFKDTTKVNDGNEVGFKDNSQVRVTNGQVITGQYRGALFSSEKKREVRVFLSSTFQDMHKERDELVKKVFPEIKKRCAEMGVFFTEIDLRWGITAEQSDSVIQLCLEEIDRCHPYFISMLGSRYGWIPEEYSDELKEKYPWISRLRPGEKSVTELEIMHGALNNFSNVDKKLFYFRGGLLDMAATQNIGHEEKEKVENLKKQIQGKGFNCKEYDSTKQLGRFILKDLLATINNDFPTTSTLDAFELEMEGHEKFGRSRTRIFVGREECFSKLTNHVQSYSNSKPIFLVTGAEGSGKSSLLANWSLSARAFQGMEVFTFFIGSSPASTDYHNMMRFTLQFLKKKFDIKEEITEDNKQLPRDFKRWLNTKIPQSCTLIFDGLDELHSKDAQNLLWLPETTQGGLSIVVSAKKDTLCESLLRKRNVTNLTITGLHPTEKTFLCEGILSKYGKTLSRDQMDRLLQSENTKNGLFLSTILEEIRIYGVYEEVTERLEYLLRARSTAELFERILMRLEEDYNMICPGLVKDFFCLLTVSKQGLSEDELKSILDIDTMKFRRFLSVVDEFVISHQGLLNFSHSSLKTAVLKRYLPDEDMGDRYHFLIAQYLENNPSTTLDRKCAELPWHLHKTSSSYRLVKLLSDIDVFQLLYCKTSKYLLKEYWRGLGDTYDISKMYIQSANEYKSKMYMDDLNFAHLISKIAKFLREMIKYDGAEILLKRALEIYKRLGKEAYVADTNYTLARIFWNRGKYDIAEPYCIESMKMREKLYGPNHLTVAKCLCGLGEMLIEEDPDRAKELLERSLQIRQYHLGDFHHLVSRILHDLATVEDCYGRHEEAIALHKRAIHIRERTLGERDEQLAVSWENMGVTYKLMNRPQDALDCFLKSLSINEEIHGEVHTSTASNCQWIVLALKDLRRWEEAEQMDRRQKSISEELAKMGLSVEESIVD
eukprot:CAMPEP_0174258426 /NCGR_PEP_ID=MMETSP0439-20130205/7418_1 /TAXON_ID=0 /ORGANISM="Stereomyxa ramosa, Strain Chinc5" /LENGTH=1085 /DNA_ID=CAMNT_0015341927 /DNA_START=79 /DNA_END=3336 /DNA_ORIENTATION=-